MFETDDYPKERVLSFFKYLVHAASKHGKSVNRHNTIRHFEPQVIDVEREIHRAHSIPLENINKMDRRVEILSENRREELELKIKMHYTKNKYLPFELRLKKLRARYHSTKRAKKHSKTKLSELKGKIKACDSMIRNLKKVEDSKFV